MHRYLQKNKGKCESYFLILHFKFQFHMPLPLEIKATAPNNIQFKIFNKLNTLKFLKTNSIVYSFGFIFKIGILPQTVFEIILGG